MILKPSFVSWHLSVIRRSQDRKDPLHTIKLYMGVGSRKTLVSITRDQGPVWLTEVLFSVPTAT